MNATYSPQNAAMDFNGALYGDDFPAGTPPAATPLAPSLAGPAIDPHDRRDKGPSGIFEDPVPWLVGALALGTGIIGFRFHWGPGARASASVDVADELASIIGQVFIAIAGIAIFKVLSSKTKVKALHEFAAFL